MNTDGFADIRSHHSLFSRCFTALDATAAQQMRLDSLDKLASSVDLLEAFVRRYELIDDPAIKTDDEILNWVFAETSVDLSCAIWSLSSAFYKASASSLRNAFDIATTSLYFQIRENKNKDEGAYNKFFAEWDRGDRETPNWGEMKPFIAAQPAVQRFKANTSIDVVEQAYDHFRYLCGYTHTSAYTKNGDPVTAINTTGYAPVFDERYFVRGCELTIKTICMIAMLWQLVFPQMIKVKSRGHGTEPDFTELFPGHLGALLLSHK